MPRPNQRSRSPCRSTTSNGSKCYGGGTIPMRKLESGDVSGPGTGTGDTSQNWQSHSSPSQFVAPTAAVQPCLSSNMDDQCYSSPHSRASPNRYYVPGRSVTHGVVQSRRGYVAEIGFTRYGYGYMTGRMSKHTHTVSNL